MCRIFSLDLQVSSIGAAMAAAGAAVSCPASCNTKHDPSSSLFATLARCKSCATRDQASPISSHNDTAPSPERQLLQRLPQLSSLPDESSRSTPLQHRGGLLPLDVALPSAPPVAAALPNLVMPTILRTKSRSSPPSNQKVAGVSLPTPLCSSADFSSTRTYATLLKSGSVSLGSHHHPTIAKFPIE